MSASIRPHPSRDRDLDRYLAASALADVERYVTSQRADVANLKAAELRAFARILRKAAELLERCAAWEAT